jgi:hypothetical protein
MKRLAVVSLLAIAAGACADANLCAESAILGPAATTVSTGTPVYEHARLNPEGCDLRLDVQSELVERPAGSIATLDRVGSLVRLVPDVPGRYRIRRTLDAQVVETAVVALPPGGFEALPGAVPCFRAAVGEATVVCTEIGAKGFAVPSQVFRKSDLAPLGRLGLRSNGRPSYGAGRYFLLNGARLEVAAESALPDVRPKTVTLFQVRDGLLPFPVVASGTRAVAVDVDGRLRLVDAADPANPTVTPLPQLPFLGRVHLAFSGNLAAVVGERLPGGDTGTELALVDVTDPTSASFVPFARSAIAFAGARLASAWDRGLHLHDASVPGGLVLTHRYADETTAFSLSATADRIAALTVQGVLVLAASDLSPQVFIPDRYAEQALPDGDRVYVVGAGVLRAYRITR